jgi:ribonuclease Z
MAVSVLWKGWLRATGFPSVARWPAVVPRDDGVVVEVVILGSGTPNPHTERAGSAVAIVDDSSWVMVDCGRAATQRALSAGLGLAALRAVLITHHHSDHVSDLATMAITRWTAGAVDPLTVLAPSGLSATFARRCLDVFGDQAFHGQAPLSAGARPSIAVTEFEPGADVDTVLDVDGWRASSVLVDHHPVAPAVGYRIERDGNCIAVSGDTAVCDGVRQLVNGAHLIVHEALLTTAVSASLLEWNAGARSVGELAAASQPETLVLTHLIPAPNTSGEEQAFLDEVRVGGFNGYTIVAHDLLRLPARR